MNFFQPRPKEPLLIATGLCLAALFNTTANAQNMASVKGSWLRVRDFEGDTGWVARSLTGNTPHHVVKSKVANVRSGPGTQHRIVGKVEYGELLRTREKRADWVRVERSEGVSGWIARQLLWGF